MRAKNTKMCNNRHSRIFDPLSAGEPCNLSTCRVSCATCNQSGSTTCTNWQTQKRWERSEPFTCPPRTKMRGVKGGESLPSSKPTSKQTKPSHRRKTNRVTMNVAIQRACRRKPRLRATSYWPATRENAHYLCINRQQQFSPCHPNIPRPITPSNLNTACRLLSSMLSKKAANRERPRQNPICP